MKSNLVVLVINGWGASSSRKESRTSSRVRTQLVSRDIEPHAYMAKRASVFFSRTRRFRRFIAKHASPSRDLLLVAKSYGAYLLLTEVLGTVRPSYRRVVLLTADPCWPLLTKWRPNLNKHVLFLECPVDKAVNVFAVCPPHKQAGSLVTGNGCMNIPVSNTSHKAISTTRAFRIELSAAIDYVTGL